MHSGLYGTRSDVVRYSGSLRRASGSSSDHIDQRASSDASLASQKDIDVAFSFAHGGLLFRSRVTLEISTSSLLTSASAIPGFQRIQTVHVVVKGSGCGVGAL